MLGAARQEVPCLHQPQNSLPIAGGNTIIGCHHIVKTVGEVNSSIEICHHDGFHPTLIKPAKDHVQFFKIFILHNLFSSLMRGMRNNEEETFPI